LEWLFSVGCPAVISPLPADGAQRSALYPLHIRRIPAPYPPYTRSISAVYPLHIRRIPAPYPPYLEGGRVYGGRGAPIERPKEKQKAEHETEISMPISGCIPPRRPSRVAHRSWWKRRPRTGLGTWGWARCNLSSAKGQQGMGKHGVCSGESGHSCGALSRSVESETRRC
jgi:hypothetical protein